MKQVFAFKVIAIYIISFSYLYPREMIILNSIPKCGTHLASKCIELLTKKTCYNVRWNHKVEPDRFFYSGEDTEDLKSIFFKRSSNEFVSCHSTYSTSLVDIIIKSGYKCIFIYRDPRAQVVSMARWKIKFNANKGMNLSDSIMSLIGDSALYKVGWRNVENILGLYVSYMPWALNDKFLAIRFEDLVGPQGGGELKTQIQTVSAIANFIGVQCKKRRLESIAKGLFGGTSTFNEGLVDGWKEYFTDEHKKAFKKVAGQLLIDLGYEKNFNW